MKIPISMRPNMNINRWITYLVSGLWCSPRPMGLGSFMKPNQKSNKFCAGLPRFQFTPGPNMNNTVLQNSRFSLEHSYTLMYFRHSQESRVKSQESRHFWFKLQSKDVICYLSLICSLIFVNEDFYSKYSVS